MEVADTLPFLLGRWSLVRAIHDHRSGRVGRFDGTADLVGEKPAGSVASMARAHYEETGWLRIGAHEGPARRRLGFVRRDDGGAAVEFADGRPFIVCDLRSGRWRTVHDCGDDRYEVSFSVGSADAVEELWRVGGPEKDYEARTAWRRVGKAQPDIGACAWPSP